MTVKSKVELTRFQKNPDLLFHLHFVLLRPIAIFPGSQRTIHVAPSHVAPATPTLIIIEITMYQQNNLMEEPMEDINANPLLLEFPQDDPIHHF